jgi:cytochrome c5
MSRYTTTVIPSRKATFMPYGMTLRAAFVVFALAAAITASTQIAAQSTATAPAAETPRDPPPALPAAVLKDPKVIAAGATLWKENCQHCHDSKAYPGKAPKLQPTKYKPGIRLGPGAQRLSRHAGLERTLQPRASHLTRRLGDE